VTIRGDLAVEDNCQRAVKQTVTELGGPDVLVNNVATQEPVEDLAELSIGPGFLENAMTSPDRSRHVELKEGDQTVAATEVRL
jgi:NAD(P)-dependent dehydrogenase (short-subunit alcohol dehydrogenase family)